MTKFKIICIATLLVFFANFAEKIVGVYLNVTELDVNWNQPKGYPYDRKAFNYEVHANEPVGSINRISGDTVVLRMQRVSVYQYSKTPIDEQGWEPMLMVLNILQFISIAYVVFLLVLFVKIIHAFVTSKVFEFRIVRWLNIIGLSCVGLSIYWTARSFLVTYYTECVLDIVAVSVSYKDLIDWVTLGLGLVVLLMTELIKQAAVIKEDNDLTI